ncbi:MAG: ArsC family reductase [Gammaproteobacteria bacterium]|nr:ArsC family reductase [Gammaproteobacteria bacterium]MBQ0839019.1 ArsC family reductase [Gammaproteobacteria bacterium]
MTVLFGIKNCDTVRKARRWLEEHDVAFTFHDVRSDGLSQQQVARWIDALGLEVVLNKRSTSWKKIDPAKRENLDENSVNALLVELPTLIKRPVLEYDGAVYVGFKADTYNTIFAANN